jgi:hypothetical protein
MKLSDLKIGDKIKFKTSKNSLKVYYGTVLGFKLDKVRVSKYKHFDYSGTRLETYIDETEILT